MKVARFKPSEGQLIGWVCAAVGFAALVVAFLVFAAALAR
jgi:hypothetical protein